MPEPPICPECRQLIFSPQTLESHNCTGNIAARIDAEIALASRGPRGAEPTDEEILLEAQLSGFRPLDPKLYREIVRRGLLERLAAIEKSEPEKEGR